MQFLRLIDSNRKLPPQYIGKVIAKPLECLPVVTAKTVRDTVELSLENRGIEAIPPDSFEVFHNLETLNLNGNRLHDLENLACCYRLKNLFLSRNQLTLQSIENGLLSLRYLEQMDLSMNHITNLSKALDVLENFQNLRMLILSGNSICQEANYRLRIIARFATLESLDHIRITPEERDKAQLLYGHQASGQSRVASERTLKRTMSMRSRAMASTLSRLPSPSMASSTRNVHDSWTNTSSEIYYPGYNYHSYMESDLKNELSVTKRALAASLRLDATKSLVSSAFEDASAQNQPGSASPISSITGDNTLNQSQLGLSISRYSDPNSTKNAAQMALMRDPAAYLANVHPSASSRNSGWTKLIDHSQAASDMSFRSGERDLLTMVNSDLVKKRGNLEAVEKKKVQVHDLLKKEDVSYTPSIKSLLTLSSSTALSHGLQTTLPSPYRNMHTTPSTSNTLPRNLALGAAAGSTGSIQSPASPIASSLNSRLISSALVNLIPATVDDDIVTQVTREKMLLRGVDLYNAPQNTSSTATASPGKQSASTRRGKSRSTKPGSAPQTAEEKQAALLYALAPPLPKYLGSHPLHMESGNSDGSISPPRRGGSAGGVGVAGALSNENYPRVPGTPGGEGSMAKGVPVWGAELPRLESSFARSRGVSGTGTMKHGSLGNSLSHLAQSAPQLSTSLRDHVGAIGATLPTSIGDPAQERSLAHSLLHSMGLRSTLLRGKRDVQQRYGIDSKRRVSPEVRHRIALALGLEAPDSGVQSQAYKMRSGELGEWDVFRLRKIFEVADTDGSGQLSMDEILTCLISCADYGFCVSMEDSRSHVASLKAEADELQAYLSNARASTPKRMAKSTALLGTVSSSGGMSGHSSRLTYMLEEMFNMIDTDKSGTASWHEFYTALVRGVVSRNRAEPKKKESSNENNADANGAGSKAGSKSEAKAGSSAVASGKGKGTAADKAGGGKGKESGKPPAKATGAAGKGKAGAASAAADRGGIATPITGRQGSVPSMLQTEAPLPSVTTLPVVVPALKFRPLTALECFVRSKRHFSVSERHTKQIQELERQLSILSSASAMTGVSISKREEEVAVQRAFLQETIDRLRREATAAAEKGTRLEAIAKSLAGFHDPPDHEPPPSKNRTDLYKTSNIAPLVEVNRARSRLERGRRIPYPGDEIDPDDAETMRFLHRETLDLDSAIPASANVDEHKLESMVIRTLGNRTWERHRTKLKAREPHVAYEQTIRM